MSSFAKFTVAQLKAECKKQGLDETGKKAELLERSDDAAAAAQRDVRFGSHTRHSAAHLTDLFIYSCCSFARGPLPQAGVQHGR